MSVRVDRYPLCWPVNWPRAIRPSRAKFGATKAYATSGYGKRALTTAEGISRLLAACARLGATSILVSSNVKVNREGLPYSGTREPDDSGVAVYFTLKGRERVLACDKWDRVADNLAAIAAHIDAMRGIERWGVGTIDQAFAGYTALPAKGETSTSSWRSVLHVRDDANIDDAEHAFRILARVAHPDIEGGSAEAMDELIRAREDARRELGVKP